MTTFDCENPLNIASTDYVDCVATTVSGALQGQMDNLPFSSRMVAVDPEEVAVKNTTTWTVAYSGTVPANTLSDGRVLRLTVAGYIDNQGPGAPAQVDTIVRYGGVGFGVTNTEPVTGWDYFKIVTDIVASGTDNQKGHTFISMSPNHATSGGSSLTADRTTQWSRYTHTGVNSTQDQSLTVQFKWDVADDRFGIYKELAYLELL